jgi:hypothetical protein
LKKNIKPIYFKTKALLSPVLLGIIIAISTFPSINLSYNIGIDAPMMWISSFFFDNQWEVVKNVIFPHGPLAFLVYPTGSNIELAIGAELFLKVLLTIQVVRLIEDTQSLKWLISFFTAYTIILLSNFIFLIIFSIALSYCNYFNTSKNRDKYIAFFLTGFAFYIKSYVGIISCMISGSFLLYYWIGTKKYKTFLIDALTLLSFIFVLWFGIHGTLSGFFRYCFGLFNLAQDNSSAAAYYPTNNWTYLVPFLGFTFAYPFIYRSPKSLFFAAITTLSLFAAWKHGMAREDVYHIRGTFSYALIVFLIFYIFNQKQHLSFLVFGGAVLALFHLNMHNAYAYQTRAYVLFDGLHNFTEYVQNLSAIKERSKKASLTNIKSNRLPESVVQQIGNSTVDVYPWDYTIIPANDFNFQPRPILQSYAAYTSWLDLQDAEHFESKLAPEYLIWDLNKITTGLDIGTMSSLDYRHLLNDEPQTIITLLKQYELWYNDANYLVYKRRTTPLNTTTNILQEDTSTWGKWIKTPSNSSVLLRAKLSFDKSFLQSLKSFFYKDEQFYIYMKFSDGTVQKYRIVPKNAVDGLWINPFVIDPANPYKQESVVAIAFDASNKKILADKLEVAWESINFPNVPNYPDLFFGKTKPPYPIWTKTIQTFEQPMDSSWSAVPINTIVKEEAFGGKNALRVTAFSYSCSYEIALDSNLVNKKLQITSSCWAKGGNLEASKTMVLVCTINYEKENLLWEGQKLHKHILDETTWNCINQTIHYQPKVEGEKLKVYFWNNSAESILIDDFQLTVQVLEEK